MFDRVKMGDARRQKASQMSGIGLNNGPVAQPTHTLGPRERAASQALRMDQVTRMPTPQGNGPAEASMRAARRLGPMNPAPGFAEGGPVLGAQLKAPKVSTKAPKMKKQPAPRTGPAIPDPVQRAIRPGGMADGGAAGAAAKRQQGPNGFAEGGRVPSATVPIKDDKTIRLNLVRDDGTTPTLRRGARTNVAFKTDESLGKSLDYSAPRDAADAISDARDTARRARAALPPEPSRTTAPARRATPSMPRNKVGRAASAAPMDDDAIARWNLKNNSGFKLPGESDDDAIARFKAEKAERTAPREQTAAVGGLYAGGGKARSKAPCMAEGGDVSKLRTRSDRGDMGSALGYARTSKPRAADGYRAKDSDVRRERSHLNPRTDPAGDRPEDINDMIGDFTESSAAERALSKFLTPVSRGPRYAAGGAAKVRHGVATPAGAPKNAVRHGKLQP